MIQARAERLTVTKVVFELNTQFYVKVELKGLTVTKVVFEFDDIEGNNVDLIQINSNKGCF